MDEGDCNDDDDDAESLLLAEELSSLLLSAAATTTTLSSAKENDFLDDGANDANDDDANDERQQQQQQRRQKKRSERKRSERRRKIPSYAERKSELEEALLVATLLERRRRQRRGLLLEDEDEDEEDEEDEATLSSTTTTKVSLTDKKEAIERELARHDALGAYLNEIARFARLRKTSHSGAASSKKRRAKRPKDRASNQKKPRQGLTREDMRREHRRWCAACQTFVKKEDALSVTKVLNPVVVSDADGEEARESYANFIEATSRKERRCQKAKTKKKLLPHASVPAPTYKIVAFDHKRSSKSNPPPNGRSMFVCRRVCCVKMLNAKRVASNLKYKMSSKKTKKSVVENSSTTNNNSSGGEENSNTSANSNSGGTHGASTTTTTASEIMRDLKLLAERAERDDGVDSSLWKLRKPDGDAKGRHPHRWTEPPEWIKPSPTSSSSSSSSS